MLLLFVYPLPNPLHGPQNSTPSLPYSSAPLWTWCWVLSMTSWVSWTVSPSCFASFGQHPPAPNGGPACRPGTLQCLGGGPKVVVQGRGPTLRPLECCVTDALRESLSGHSPCPQTPFPRHAPPPSPGVYSSGLRVKRLSLSPGSTLTVCALGEILSHFLISKTKGLALAHRGTRE